MSRDTISGAPHGAAEIEASILGVLLTAESARSGAAAILDALRPLTDDATVAIAVRDRDGARLHVLAESGGPQRWPELLAPRAAVGGEPAVDPATSTMIVPLQAHGRVCGALLFADTAVASELLHGDVFSAALGPAAEVLRALLERTDAEVRDASRHLRSIDSIIDGIAHQIANPLTGASATAQLLADDVHDDGHRAAVSLIRQEMARAFTVIADLLDFHRDTHAHDGILDLNVVVDRVTRFRGYSIREQGIALEVRPAEAYAPVRADAAGLELALLHAVRHAELRSHGTVNRSVLVRVLEHGDREFAVEITDSGPGDEPDVSPRYFDIPFTDGGERGRRQPGLPDLGLADSILRACGGSLQKSASKTAGTTLRLVLPRAHTGTYTSTPATAGRGNDVSRA